MSFIEISTPTHLPPVVRADYVPVLQRSKSLNRRIYALATALILSAALSSVCVYLFTKNINYTLMSASASLILLWSCGLCWVFCSNDQRDNAGERN